MASDAAGGALGALVGLLGLEPDDGPTPAGSGPTLGLVGTAEAPRFLLPLDHRAATLAACTAYDRLRPLRARAGRWAVALASATPLRRRVVTRRYVADAGPGSLLHHLSEVLGAPDLQVAVGVGNHDEVWKPTLQCFTPDGEPIAYAKVGLGPVGAELVAVEGDALASWDRCDDPRLVVPTLTARTAWRDVPVVCTAPMPPDVRRLPPGPVSPWPVRLLDEPLADRPITEAPWWTGRVGHHADDHEVAELLAAIEKRHAAGDRSWARWHGDWVPWNLARSDRGLVAWDWEYSEPGAPVGLDEVHGEYQRHRVLAGRPVAEALAAARATTPDPWLADAHLAMLITRHARLGRLAGTELGDSREVLAASRRLLGLSTGGGR